MKRNWIVYIITNNFNDKVYIGQTVKSLKERFAGMYGNKMYNAMQEIGQKNFRIDYLRICKDQYEADHWEKWYIKYYNSTESGYNVLKGGRINRISDDNLEKIKELYKTKLYLAREIAEMCKISIYNVYNITSDLEGGFLPTIKFKKSRT